MVFKKSDLRRLIRESIKRDLHLEAITATPTGDDTKYKSTGAYEPGPYFLPQGLFNFLFGGRGVPGSLYSVIEAMFTTKEGWIGLGLLAYVFRADLQELEANIEKWITENYGRTEDAIRSYQSNIDGGMSQEAAMDIIQEAIKDDTSLLLGDFLRILSNDEVLEMLRALDGLFDLTGSSSERSLEGYYTEYFQQQGVSGLQAATQQQIEDAIGNVIIPGIYNGMVHRAQQYSTNTANTIGAIGISSKIGDGFEEYYIQIDPYGSTPIFPTTPAGP